MDAALSDSLYEALCWPIVYQSPAVAYIKPLGKHFKFEEQGRVQVHVSMRTEARQGNIHRMGMCKRSGLPETLRPQQEMACSPDGFRSCLHCK